MTNAYDKIYLEKAQTVLGRMTDYAVYDLEYAIDEIFDLFIKTGYAKRFENGDYQVLVGMSGVELARHVVVEAMGREVCLVQGNRENIKLTTPFDLKIAEVLI